MSRHAAKQSATANGNPQSEIPNPQSENPQSAIRNPQSAIRNRKIRNRKIRNRYGFLGVTNR